MSLGLPIKAHYSPKRLAIYTPSLIILWSINFAYQFNLFKVIRFCDPDHIRKIQDEVENLKVVVLFRDPRGIYGSRKSLVSPAQLLKTVSYEPFFWARVRTYVVGFRPKFQILKKDFDRYWLHFNRHDSSIFQIS